MKKVQKLIVWIRRELRLDDHLALWSAAQDAVEVIPLFIQNGEFQRLAPAKQKVMIDALNGLRVSLVQRASGCTIGRQYPAPIVDHARERTYTLELFGKINESKLTSRWRGTRSAGACRQKHRLNAAGPVFEIGERKQINRMNPYVLKRTQHIRKPLAEVFSFFSKPENLELLTPRDLGFRILTPSPIIMKQGAVIDYTIKIAGVPVRWRTLISLYEPPHRFIDLQLKGPYSSWEHIHTFTEVGDGTRIDDEVRYSMPFGILGKFVHTLFVQRQLSSIFSLRASRIQTIFTEFNTPELERESVLQHRVKPA